MFTITKKRISPIESYLESQFLKLTPLEGLFRDFNSNNNSVKSNIVNQDSFQEIQVCVPGIDKKFIEISLDDFVLSIKYELADDKSESLKEYSLREFCKSSFEKKFILPKDSDFENIISECTNGVLYIKIPKANYSKNKKRTFKIK